MADGRVDVDGRHGIWSLRSWCEQFGCSVGTFYVLPVKPYHMRVRDQVRITESPAEFAKRIAREQREAAAQANG